MAVPSTNPSVELEECLRFETLIADCSSKFVNVPAEAVNREDELPRRSIHDGMSQHMPQQFRLYRRGRGSQECSSTP